MFLDSSEMKHKKHTGRKPMSENILELIEQFEKDIIYDCHNLGTRIRRSEALKSLVKTGQQALRPIINHLKENSPSDPRLKNAWGSLLNLIEIEIDERKSGPQKLANTEGWIAWAEKFADQN